MKINDPFVIRVGGPLPFCNFLQQCVRLGSITATIYTDWIGRQRCFLAYFIYV